MKIDRENIKTPHEPFFEEFISSEEDSYDLENTFFMNCEKKWKIAKYKNHILKNFYISENMDLYSKFKNKLVDKIRINSNGEKTYSFQINKKVFHINIRDILASTFLKIPNEAVVSVYRNHKKNKYNNELNHYTNLKWLCKKDFVFLGDPKNGYILSNRGDIYSTNNNYNILKQEKNKNGLRKITLNLKYRQEGPQYKDFILHYHVGINFVYRKDESYKYCIHKNGDITNNHYRNLIWLNTLSGIHNDGIKYTEIPNFPGYVLSEKDILYSFKNGLFKEIKLINGDRYKKVRLYDKNNKRQTIRFHRLVAFVKNEDFNFKLQVDHIDRNKENNLHENLRCVDVKENNKNKNLFPGKKILLQFDGNEKLLNSFDNINMASNITGIKKKLIQRCAFKNNKDYKNNKHKSGGYIWRYKNVKEKYKEKDGEFFVKIYGKYQGVELYFDNYMISNFGTIINYNRFSITPTNRDYPSVKLIKNKIPKYFSVHRLVALIFVKGKTEEKNEVHHIDENCYNYSADNLKWVSRKENMKLSAHKFSKPVNKICVKTGEILETFNSRKEAADSLKVTASSINIVCDLDNRTAHGFIWKSL